MNKCLDIRLFSFRCPDIVWVIESSFYNCIVQDVKQVTESFADIDFRSLKNNSGYMFFILQVCFVNPVTPGVYLKVMHT